MTRLLFFMHTSSQIGGVETWLDRACHHLASRGFEPVVGLVRGQQYNSPDRYIRHHPELNTLVVDGRGLNREGRVRALVRSIRKTRARIVLPLGIIDANEAVIRQKLRGADVRLLGRAQGNLEPMLADLRTYREWMDRVICPGRLTQRLLIDWAGYPAERVLNISNGADEPVAARVPRAEGQPLRIGYVGRLSQPDKRALDLIALCRTLGERGIPFHLDVVGDGPCGAELAQGLAEWAPEVTLHGALPHREIYQRIFPNLDVLVLTSSSEAFGIVLVEAMMHGVVPVSSRYHGFHSEQLVVEEQTGLSFDVGDMASAADAIERLQQSPALLAKLSLGAIEKSRNYTWQQSMSRWERALVELAGQPPLIGGDVPAVAEPSNPGRLDRLGMPAGLTDLVRRARRSTLGPAVSAGGEEWPLFYRTHSPEYLEEIRQVILRTDTPLRAPAEMDATRA